ncbi:hypothetical protein Dimus_015017 [Dionaea muscipula]
MINTKSKERKSLCEESMLVLVNILKLSSLSLAGKSLAVATAGDHQPSRKTSKKSVTKATEGAPSSTNSSSHPDGSKKARWPWSDTGSRLSYVVLPAGDQGRMELHLPHMLFTRTTPPTVGSRITSSVSIRRQKMICRIQSLSVKQRIISRDSMRRIGLMRRMNQDVQVIHCFLHLINCTRTDEAIARKHSKCG